MRERWPGVVRSLGLEVGSAAQVSCNLVAPAEVGPAEVYDFVVASVGAGRVARAEEVYRKLLAENKARAALVEAARQPKVTIEGSPETRCRPLPRSRGRDRRSRGRSACS